ncbi:AI-2E family transporter [Paracoccus sp. 1_MG-2023]|uniref:AI-2E family transporter n=1 Tax=unclassified Paracoccus (in: a-proteobacteria) TaxID=2688777 RepID=UPI001C09F672|nr:MULTISPECIES: AI-2E family transporter [unclassified Paracoccus (in: a-proteobacteria)]MBU2956319.1 AI-2E family transporter [Paracoccus sp. C2R09]MDO6667995.1 AI-2E family transporter [Paracoccus sp. 1_MG-2023]
MPQASGNLFPRRTAEEKATQYPRILTWSVTGIFMILAFSAIAAGRDFLMPVTMALLLFFVFTPLRRLAERRNIPDGITALVITLSILTTVGIILYAASGPLTRAMDNMPVISAQLERKFESVRESFSGIQDAVRRIDEAQEMDGEDAAEAPAIKVERDGQTTFGTVLSMTPLLMGQILFTMVLLFFMIASGDLLYLKIVQSFDRLREKRSAYLALREIEESLGNYLGAITIINAGLGLAVGLTMWAWGMPGALLFGIGAFVLNYIPYLGAITGVAISGLVALVVMPGLFWPGMVALSYLGLTSLEGQIITPYFVSRRLQMNTVVVFLAVALWAWLWSVIGMVIAVPVLVVLRVLAEHVPGWEKFGNFLAGEDPPPLEDSDETDARDLVESGASAEDHDAARIATRQVMARDHDSTE